MVEYEDQTVNKSSQAQPSVLDWFHSILRLKPIPIPVEEEVQGGIPEGLLDLPAEPVSSEEAVLPMKRFTWRDFLFPLSTVLILLAQAVMIWIPQSGVVTAALVLMSAALFGLQEKHEAVPGPEKYSISEERTRVQVNLGMFSAGLLFSIATYLLSGMNRFTLLSFLAWSVSILLTAYSFRYTKQRPCRLLQGIWNWVSNPRIDLKLGREEILLIVIFVLSGFFRFYRLDSVPVEMWSDQAEKLLDVADVLDGKYSIFFLRNTGREAFQFYLSAAVAKIFGTGISFLTLKIGTALLGFLTLPFIYLFARETVGRKAAMFALLLAGVAYWPNVISRAGLRFPLYPFFAAPAMYFLVRGIRRRNINDFVWCGIAVGFGLHGYSPARVIPVVIIAGVLIFLAHVESRGWRKQAFTYLITAGLIALVILMPLLRVAVEMPDRFLFRMLSRMGEVEREIPGNPMLIFMDNLWDALKMFNVDNGEIWILGPTHRPAFDYLTGSFFLVGIVMIIIRYLWYGRWKDLYLLISIPLLLLPSILSLAFPSENPALNRASGAFIPAFAAAGLGLAYLADWFRKQLGKARLVETAVIAICLILVAVSNYRIIFTEYSERMAESVWNTSDAGRVLEAFAESTGSYDTGHVVAFPYWMDTRLVGMHAGQTRKDYAIWPDELHTLEEETRPQLFIVNMQDEEGLGKLRELFPEGVVKLYNSPIEGHDFLIYSVP